MSRGEDDEDERSVVHPLWHVEASEAPSEKHDAAVSQLRNLLHAEPLAHKFAAMDETVMRRFCTARDNRPTEAFALLKQALEWREKRQPHLHDYAELEMEARTGKVRVSPQLDRHGRAVVIFDNSCENTRDADAQMRYLAFSLEHALRRCARPVQKFVVFMHLTNFSLRNNPTWAVTKETALMTSCCFAECCGHIVLHRAPSIFAMAFRLVTPLIDPKTATKIVFASGDDAPGSANDSLLTDILGPDWRAITGTGGERETSGSSPGYVHEENWRRTLEDELNWRLAYRNEGPLRHELRNWPGGDERSLPWLQRTEQPKVEEQARERQAREQQARESSLAKLRRKEARRFIEEEEEEEDWREERRPRYYSHLKPVFAALVVLLAFLVTKLAKSASTIVLPSNTEQ